MLEQIHQVVPPNRVKHFFDVKIAKESSRFFICASFLPNFSHKKFIMDDLFIYKRTLGQLRQHHHLGD
jgi:hypothetical protein